MWLQFQRILYPFTIFNRKRKHIILEPFIYILIPVLNRIDATRNCLDSLRKQSYQNFQIVICDHGSADGTRNMLRSEYPDVKLILGEDHLWWTGAINKCLEYALSVCSEQDFILTLNNDLFVKKDYLISLLNASIENKKSIIGSLLMDMDNPEKIAYAGEIWNPWMAKTFWIKDKYRNYSDIDEKYIESTKLPGKGVLFSVQVIKEIGHYDSRHFPHYGADNDFSLRARKNGYRLIVSTESIIYTDVDNKGYDTVHHVMTIKSYIKSLFDRKSSRNIYSRTNMAFAYIPWFYIPVYILLDHIRVTGSFFRDYIQYKIGSK